MVKQLTSSLDRTSTGQVFSSVVSNLYRTRGSTPGWVRLYANHRTVANCSSVISAWIACWCRILRAANKSQF
ncbi:hypothetical protein J6590_042435 [Homalodisca vitripennis]|nr:hypothetical protein J6590_042435 [Homalodisca vitripennis]